MNCLQCEERMSDYLEGALSLDERRAVESHVRSCIACRDLLAGISEVLTSCKTFPVYEPAAWLSARILANTPRVARESCVDTITAAWKWVINPRIAMGAFTGALVLGWLGSLAGISPQWTTVVRNPAAIYYEAQGAMNRAYDEAIRRYYRSPVVNELRTRIEQIMEIS